jgi:hypothetical protein
MTAMVDHSVRHSSVVYVILSSIGSLGFRRTAGRVCVLLAVFVTLTLLAGCRFFGGAEPTRTPIPTFTPTPILVVVPAGAVPTNSDMEQAARAGQSVQEPQPASEEPTSTPVPPTNTPTIPPTATPTDTPAATATLTPTPTPTPVPDYQFDLESAQKFPTESLAPGIVRIFLYVYAPGGFGLDGYGLRILHNGASLATDARSSGGLPELTRTEPGPYTRFTNMNVIIVEPQAGDWIVQLVDAEGRPAGPPAQFQLSADEETRELYVRYRQGED